MWRKSKKRRKRREKEAWNTGADYIKRGWEIAWNELIDARFLESYTTTVRQYKCIGDAAPLRLVSADQIDRHGGNGNNCIWVNTTVTKHRWVNTPSDGLIIRGSARGQQSRWGNTRTVELRGVNHAEMGTHERVDQLFRDAFERRNNHNQFFRTNRR